MAEKPTFLLPEGILLPWRLLLWKSCTLSLLDANGGYKR